MLRYIELKSGQNDKGPAWIARVKLSRSGNTVYFDDRALKRGGAIAGNHVDLETGEEYWISGVKKDGNDRHWAGSGKTFIEESAVAEYLDLVGKSEIDNSSLVIIDDLPETNIQRFVDLENACP
jgi:hypothetical protein